MAVTPEQLRDPKFGRVGVSASVMDYNALNIATRDERQGSVFDGHCRPYDIWAIEYGYKGNHAGDRRPNWPRPCRALEAATPTQPMKTPASCRLSKASTRVVNRSDLSSDPLGFYEKRFTVIRELWDRVQAKELPAGTSTNNCAATSSAASC